MPIQHLNASSYQKRLTTGRTKPCLFICEDDSGEINGEYVVKLKAGMEHRETGLASELIASQLAMFLDIPTPEPAIINLNPDMTEVIGDAELATKITESAGLNFGSRFITGGFDTWPVGEAIPLSLKQLACEIFAFDSLIQNPDRKPGKPNVLWKGNELYIIDHEMGFSFVYGILISHRPWQVTELNFLRNHLFYQGLKGQDVNLDRFAGALETLSAEKIASMISNIPAEWNNAHISRITDHLNEVIKHINEFVDEIRRVLQ
ncbi:MAG: hypothetical protein C4538_06145 [Nitrospiraceae bacterium]|nr:MAG: hypothetical protein C4538_06145 [Nitrospiraceae bacterium]